MPTPDQDFIRKLQATFKLEAEEHLQTLASMLLELEKSNGSAPMASSIEVIYREAHSLKGAARAVDLSDVEAICQAMEDVFSVWKRQQVRPSQEAFDTFHDALETIRNFIDGSPAESGGSKQSLRDELIRRIRKCLPSQAGASDIKAVVSELPPDAPVILEKASAVQTVRITTERLDAQLLQAEEMLVMKSVAARRAAELREMESVFEQWRKEWAKVSSEARSLRQESEATTDRQISTSSVAIVNFLDWNCDYIGSLQARIASLAIRAEEDRRSVGRQIDDLLEDSKKLLMLPFSNLTVSFPKLVRDLCRDQSKEADLVIQGGEIEIDKRILEEMKDALIHILRNSVDHGIEMPDERLRQNKPRRGTITLAASTVNGNKVEISVSDDGRGIDVEQVRLSAISHGVLSEAEVKSLGDVQAAGLIFRSEVSTSPQVTSISGRGLGMAIVQSKIEKLGGTVSVESKPRAGTMLRMLLPLTLATFRGILVEAADCIFVVPTVSVERVIRIKAQEIHTVENRESISYQGSAVSLVRLYRLLSLTPKGVHRDEEAPLPVVILRAAGQRIAFVVDAVLHEEEVLVKPLRKPLVRLRNIAGVTVVGSGKAVPVLNVDDLMKSARIDDGGPERAAPASVSREKKAKDILVVEDSITSRMLVKGILESAGYTVKTAVDGMEAFAMLREGRFDLVVSDVEMPRMNGLDLTIKIRADQRMANLPVVLITALESREQRERGMDAGANAYIVKSSFDQSNLLEAVSRLV